MSNPAANFATPRVAAGALFVDGDRVLLVRKTYGERWDIPGGYVDRGESPAQACRREIREELGLNRAVGDLLVVDWAPRKDEGDKLLFVFSGGDIGDDQNLIRLDQRELDHWQWTPVDKLTDYLNSRLCPRIEQAYQAHRTGKTANLEHGKPAEPAISSAD